MEKQKVYIRMFGTMELEYGGKVLSEAEVHSQKQWLLLAYIIYFRHKTIPQKELLKNLWDLDDEGSNVLKTAMHRLRAMLSDAFGTEFGHTFICCHNKQCFVGEQYEVSCDYEVFEEGLKQEKKQHREEKQLEIFRNMFELYRGDFLNNFSEKAWITPISIYYRSVYLELVQTILAICETQKFYKEAIELLGRAGEVMKYEESIYVPLIRILVHMENYEDAVQVYERLDDMLTVTYGVKPSKEAKNLYHEAVQALNAKKLGIEELPAIMQQETAKGALYCEFELFKTVYQAYVRGAERNESTLCLALIDITDLQDNPLSKRSLSTCVTNLIELLCGNLRSGDIVSMCTASQFALLLQNTNEENAKVALERIKKVFYRQYPHTPAKLTCYIKNL